MAARHSSFVCMCVFGDGLLAPDPCPRLLCPTARVSRSSHARRLEATLTPEEAASQALHRHKLKTVVLEVFSKLPQSTEVLRPYAEALLTTCSSMLESDAEEVALLALRTIFELHKTYRGQWETQAK